MKKEEETKKKSHFRDYRLFYLLIAAIIIYALRNLYMPYILEFLFSNPSLNGAYMFSRFHIVNYTYVGLFLATFLGALFFMVMPAEVILFYYFTSGAPIALVLIIAALGTTAGLFVDYIFGFLLGKKIWMILLKNKYHSFEAKVQKNGALLVFFFNLIPFPIDLFSIVVGSVRFSLKRFLIYSFLGKILYYAILFRASSYIIEYGKIVLS